MLSAFNFTNPFSNKQFIISTTTHTAPTLSVVAKTF